MRDRKKLLRVLVALCGLVAFACLPENDNSITPGRYQSESSDEWIVVTPNRMIFHVNFHVDEPDRLTKRETEYRLYPDGLIKFSMSSAEFFQGLSWYWWYWRDGKIAKIDPDTEQTIWFVRAND